MDQQELQELEEKDWNELEQNLRSKEHPMGVDVFLKIDGCDGESQDSKHKNEIEILGWLGDVDNLGSSSVGGGSGSGVSIHYPWKFAKLVDKATAKIFEKCSNGEHFKKAVLVFRKAGKEQQEFMKLTFSDVMVAHYRHFKINDPVTGLPRDGFALGYGKMEYEYKDQKDDGTLGGVTKGVWDVKKRQAS